MSQLQRSDGFNGRTALVTGAGSGIGLETALLFAERGANIIATDRTLAHLSGLAERLRSTGLVEALLLEGDLAEPGAADRIVNTVLSRGDRIDILCNIAGIIDNALLAHELPDDVWAHVLAVNLTAQFQLSRAVLPSMLAQRRGVIICTSSTAGLGGGRAGTAYTVAKHGVIGLAQSLAAAYGDRGVRSVAICPGAMSQKTGAIESAPSTEGAAMVARIQQTRPQSGSPREAAGVIVFAASDDASHVNGATLVVDGGWSSF
jgi:NAD(P)-dependent dehydrogenase (short-subunit alcohol dehydrogenase family)